MSPHFLTLVADIGKLYDSAFGYVGQFKVTVDVGYGSSCCAFKDDVYTCKRRTCMVFHITPDSESGLCGGRYRRLVLIFRFYDNLSSFYSVGESVCGENFFYDFVHGFGREVYADLFFKIDGLFIYEDVAAVLFYI